MLQDAQKRRAAGDILTITEIERASCLFTFQFFSTFSFNSCTSTKNREEISDEMKVDHDEGEDDHNDNEEEEKDDKEEEEIKEERDDKGLGKDIHNKAFQYPQKPKEHTKAVKEYDWG
ncbi:uncharacterized protein MONOS_16496 [Monocercomonoides exilis]|uniref:uncharacterized protein n=1 Tax=Monocercomonoides exilis TaxID=2049356 RepID=UPI00355AB6E6|nr:hypothetical protein MONOS_16496 [Monocercomonoides exilis]|eukprot:MONOS_16496.1-p1 / transcript=MONOS_16496.1 / gene=MONOS_16496 / organism=Monocercomonoides_exilis_PA203 / gene_product=unspecified product / transcript_product=unspecified product / location=Mono_scaffold01793:2978-3331(+) / protein_length=118 / sequence_SO=supercontig / SO=protein_coding / is_pseudo=false